MPLDARRFRRGGWRYAARIALCCLCGAGPGTAGVIRLPVTAEPVESAGRAALRVELRNEGDAPARDVELEASLGVWRHREPLRRELGPGETVSLTLPIAGPPAAPGRYPAIVRARYGDLNGYRFSSVAVTAFAVGGVGAGDDEWVIPTLAPTVVEGAGTLKLQTLSLEAAPGPARARLVLPDELACDAPERGVELEPDILRTVEFSVVNRRATPGSAYAVWALVEGERDGRHLLEVVEGVVQVTGRAAPGWRTYAGWAAAGMALCAVLMGLGRRRGAGAQGATEIRPTPGNGRVTGAVLAMVTLFVLWQLAPLDLLRNTTTVGGDTPAHHYLAGHLKTQLLHHGRIVSWADGWWCGFPMFQYYFCLPYLAMALGSLVIPFNIAFKLGSVAGLVLTPLCAYLAGRLWRLPRPAPLALAVAMAPFLFVRTHVMWGVNTSSTLAGMIANSWSFALMLVAVASVTRDAADGRFRWRSVALLVLVIASHFFTSVMLVLTLAAVPVLVMLGRSLGVRPEGASASAMAEVCIKEGGLAALLMAWWWVPLLAKSGYSVDFGSNWPFALAASFPPYTAAVLVFAVVALAWGWRRRWLAVGVCAWLGACSLLLFRFGFAVSPVFVNVRLWPFLFFAVMALGAIGAGLLLGRVRGQAAWVVAGAVAVLVAVRIGDSVAAFPGPGLTRTWAEWNFSGLESKPGGRVFERLVLPLRGTPGRLANDLADENNPLGSSRIFELAPHLAGKPVLEGGIVNSAIGSLYAYYLQGETSRSSAGFPALVTPATFDMERGTRHLELFNVKHFIARSPETQAALRRLPEWRFLEREGAWELFELTSHEGRAVTVLTNWPVGVETEDWKRCSLEWLYTPQALDRFAIFVRPGETNDLPPGLDRLAGDAFRERMKALRTAGGAAWSAGSAVPVRGNPIREERVENDRVSFVTSALGAPHLVKISWFPNWKVRGARRVFMVSPAFLLVFPDRERVELYYGSVWSDWLGWGLTALGVLAGALLPHRGRWRMIRPARGWGIR
jgi:hypothetical protein